MSSCVTVLSDNAHGILNQTQLLVLCVVPEQGMSPSPPYNYWISNGQTVQARRLILMCTKVGDKFGLILAGYKCKPLHLFY